MVLYIIVLNLAFFLATVLSGGFTLPNLIRLGAKFGPLIAAGEWQRLLISIFLHGNLMHLFFNTYALYYLGRLAEGVFGSRKFFAVYIFSGIGGSLLSYGWHFGRAGVGASGAIFGLAGAIFASGLKHRNTSLNRMGMSILPFILINLVIGFVVPAIDNAAHIGGLLTGMAMGWLLRPGSHPFGWKRTFEEVTSWALIAFVAFSMISFFVPGISMGRASVDQVVVFHNQVQGWIENMQDNQLPAYAAVERLYPPDREASQLKEHLLDYVADDGTDPTLLRRIEEDFLVWREEVLERYQGLIQEIPAQ